MKQIIHVNQHHIRKNHKTGSKLPVLSIKTYKSNDYGHEAILKTKDGSEIGRVIYHPDKPLSCGATVWIEIDTKNVDVEIVNHDNQSLH